MKTFMTAALLGATLVAGGCGKSGDSAAMSNPEKREAGNWKTEVTLVKFEMPGVPDKVKDQMAKQFASAGATEQCVTQDQVDKEDIAGDMAKSFGEACTWSKKQIGGGHIDIAGSCTSNGQKVDLAMAGTLAAKKTDVLVISKGKAPMGGEMEMQMQVTSVNTGPCKA